MPKITVFPGNSEIIVESDLNLRDALMQNGHPIKSTCGGCASCGQCVVIVKSGFENLSEIAFEEKQLLGNVFHITQERLSCQTKVLGDITVDVSAHLQETVKPSKIVRRSREEADSIVEERKAKAKERPQRQGGFKKPKGFKTE